jgi:metallopeptidase MepB
MFHELGHAIHNLVSRTKYSLGRSRDYSEIPSVMLETWTWIPDVLVRIGRHYTALGDGTDTEGALPRDIAEAVCATRNLSRANAILAHV